MPIQRIPRYKLLLTELVKNTEPTHPDRKHAQTALGNKQIAVHVLLPLLLQCNLVG